jgi:hypothetical protein
VILDKFIANPLLCVRMLASCCGLRGKAPFEDYASGRGMDELQVELSDGRPGTLRCNNKVFELLASGYYSGRR